MTRLSEFKEFYLRVVLPNKQSYKNWWCFKKYDTTLDVPIIDIKES